MEEESVIDQLKLAIENDNPIPNIPFNILSTWTDKFDDKHIIGEGGFGKVYSGVVSKQIGRLAIKRVSELLKIKSATDTGDLEACMKREIRTLEKIRHPNVIRLYAYSMSDNVSELCLVYEYADGGGLDKYYLDADKASRLTWFRRLQIARGIVDALNHFHCKSNGGSFFHRDVKSANVVLTSTFIPKLIDCGLAKFIPEDSSQSVVTVFTKIGQRLGTPGYQCGKYLKTGDYTVQSEIYSVGIFLAELLFGHKQGSNGKYIDDEDNIDDFTPDKRAGEWPLEIINKWLLLIETSIAPLKTRFKMMLNLLHILRDMDKLVTGSVHLDPLLQDLIPLREELEKIRLEQLLLQRQKVTESSQRLRKCFNCDEECDVDDGIGCKVNLKNHFLCNNCFPGWVSCQCDKLETFKNRECKIVCELCLLNSATITEFEEIDVVAHLNQDVYKTFTDAKKRVIEGQVAERVEAETRAQIAREIEDARNKSGRVLIYKKHIEGTILATQCPGCHGTILDFDGCFALTCSREKYSGCGTEFCAFCLVPTQPGQVHAHVAQCPENPNPGEVFAKGEEFEKRNKKRIQAKLTNYLCNIPNDERLDVIQAVFVAVREIGLIIEQGADSEVNINNNNDDDSDEEEIPVHQFIGQCIHTLSGHNDYVLSVCVSPDGRHIVSGSQDKTVKVWDMESGQCIHTLNDHNKDVTSVCVSPDGRRIVSGSSDATVRVWDMESGQCIHTLMGHVESVLSVCMTPDGRHIVSGSYDEKIYVWDMESKDRIHKLSNFFSSAVRSVCVTPDGRHIVSGNDQGNVKVWDIRFEQCVHTLSDHNDVVRSVCVSPDGRHIVSGNDQGNVKVWV